jgi:hypothetical protein
MYSPFIEWKRNVSPAFKNWNRFAVLSRAWPSDYKLARWLQNENNLLALIRGYVEDHGDEPFSS